MVVYGARDLRLERELNPAQLEAATTTEGPLLVLAGAGSGKTRVLVFRIAHILNERLAYPSEILAVTFTNKAAGEMRERLLRLAGADAGRAWIGTFHSMCGRILRQEGHRLGFDRNFSIYDADDTKRAIKRVMEQLGMDTKRSSGVSVSAVAHEIERAKNQGIGPAQLARTEIPYFNPNAVAARKVYPKYQESLRKANAVDFGDLLYLTVELLEHHPEARQRYQDRFRYVLVDEFQDTNTIQYEFLKRIVDDNANLAVVGDDDQSIYGWRGAEVRNILDFHKTFAGAKVVKLEQNYRSSGNILTAANAVIRLNKNRHNKTLFTEAEPGLPIGVAMLDHGDEEAWLVAETLRARISQGEKPESFAILYRQNAQSRPFEQALRRARVPYVLIGSTAFFDRKEVKDILAYLRLIANPSSTEDFERIVNVPGRQVGDKTLSRLRDAADKAGVAGARVLELDDVVLAEAGVKGKTLERLRKFQRMLEELREIAADSTATEVAQGVVEKTRYFRHLEDTEPAKAEDRAANVEELVSSIAEHEALYREQLSADEDEPATLAGARTPLEAFLDEAALISTADRNTEEGAVSLLTLHAAKGLEFPVVFLPGMEEYTFPIRRAVEGDPGDLEEERRLCYVGFTRPMRELNLSCVRFRRIFGNEEVRRPSRFLGDIPDGIVTTFGRREPNPTLPSYRRTDERTVQVRDGDTVELDPDPFMDVDDPFEPEAEVVGMAPGARVSHNTFGEGVIERVEGSGPRAHLTIRFPTVGTKRIVARFVELSDER